MPVRMKFLLQTLYLLVFTFDVTLTQDEEECTLSANGISTWESLTSLIPYRSNIDPTESVISLSVYIVIDPMLIFDTIYFMYAWIDIDPSNLVIPHNLSRSHVCPCHSSGYTIDELSLCPWTYHMDTDYNRYPVDMHYPVSTCGRCGLPRYGRYPHCTALQHSFKVIRRVCENGVYRYFFTHERFPIACICTYRPVTYVTPVPRN